MVEFVIADMIAVISSLRKIMSINWGILFVSRSPSRGGFDRAPEGPKDRARARGRTRGARGQKREGTGAGAGGLPRFCDSRHSRARRSQAAPSPMWTVR